MKSGVAMNMMIKELGRCKSQMEVDILWMEGNKEGTYAYKMWAFMNDTSKNTFMKRVNQKEDELRG